MDYSKIYERLLFTHSILPYYVGSGNALPPIRVQIELTGRCNLKCEFCYQGEDYKTSKGELSFDEITGIIDQVPRYSLLTFSGGEPLLRKDAFDIIDYAVKRHFCNIITNGVFLTEPISRLMVDKKFFLINLSIDGIGDIHDELRGVKGTFERVKNNIDLLIDYKEKKNSKFPLIDIKTVLTKKNIQQIGEIYKFCEDKKVDFLTLSLIKNSNIQFNGTALYRSLNEDSFYKDYLQNENNYDISRIKKELKNLEKRDGRVKIRYYPRFNSLKEMDKYFNYKENRLTSYAEPCLEPWSGFQINAFGEVYPCLSYFVGNVRESKLMDIWNSNQYVEFRKRLKKLKLFPACSGCCYLKIRSNRWKE